MLRCLADKLKSARVVFHMLAGDFAKVALPEESLAALHLVHSLHFAVQLTSLTVTAREPGQISSFHIEYTVLGTAVHDGRQHAPKVPPPLLADVMKHGLAGFEADSNGLTSSDFVYH